MADAPAGSPFGSVRVRLRRELARALRLIQAHDLEYDVRNALVLHAVAAAALLGYPAGFRLDPAQAEWPVAFIELPGAGQVSWHLPQHPTPWDGHTTEEKYRRVRVFAAMADDESAGLADSPAVARLLALAELAEALAALPDPTPRAPRGTVDPQAGPGPDRSDP